MGQSKKKEARSLPQPSSRLGRARYPGAAVIFSQESLYDFVCVCLDVIEDTEIIDPHERIKVMKEMLEANIKLKAGFH